jgi:integrase/recombinase XerD
MIKFNPNNERIKRAYFEYQKEANKKSPSTVDNIRKAISRYELYTKYIGFESFNKHKASCLQKSLYTGKIKRRRGLFKQGYHIIHCPASTGLLQMAFP